jgi:hypothetical protein
MQVISEFVEMASPSPLAEERQAELRRRSSLELLALVQFHGPDLTPEELRFIHDLAIERLAHGDAPFSQGADKLSREVMHVAVRRIA